MSKIKIVRKSKTVVNKLPSFKTETSASNNGAVEPVVSKGKVAETEASVGDMYQDIFGEQGEEVDSSAYSSRGKSHVRADDDDDVQPEEPATQPKYGGSVVTEGIQPSKASDVNNAELDDLISQIMDAPAEDVSPRPTSTPSRDDANEADFGDGLSLIRGDDEPPDDKPPPKDDNQTEGGNTTITGRYQPQADSSTTTTKISYSSKYVPNIPAKFYKDLQSRLEDLIFKFECLDNEYAALQKISHSIFLETTEIKEKFSS